MGSGGKEVKGWPTSDPCDLRRVILGLSLPISKMGMLTPAPFISLIYCEEVQQKTDARVLGNPS